MSAIPSRRDLLAATVVPIAAVRGSAANSAVTVGLIGTGNRGTYVAATMAQHSPVRVAALCDIDESQLLKAAGAFGPGKPRLYSDFRKLLESGVDAVIIATPAFLHPEQFEAAVQADKHIYIEKPAAVDVQGCKRVIRAADSAKRSLNISFGFQRRYATLYRKASQLVQAGAVGPVHMGHAHFIKSAGRAVKPRESRPPSESEKRRDWYDWRELSGDLIVENNVHSIDILNWFLGGRPKSAIGFGSAIRPRQGDVRDCNLIAYEYDNGRQGQLSGTTVAPPNYRHVTEQFLGELGMVETSENFWRHLRNGKPDFTEKAPRNNTIDSVTHFIRRISEGNPENVAARGAESTLTAILGRMAMDARREVTWDEMMRG